MGWVIDATGFKFKTGLGISCRPWLQVQKAAGAAVSRTRGRLSPDTSPVIAPKKSATYVDFFAENPRNRLWEAC